MQPNPTAPLQWDEATSQTFIDYGPYFVPERETQLRTICALIPPHPEPFNVLELCCGEGLLAGALLAQHPTVTVYGYDGSDEMLRAARQRLAGYGGRFQTMHFDLADLAWRQPAWPVQAVVSSLAIHHLDGSQKQALFAAVYAMLEPGGVFVIADVVLPASRLGWSVSAAAWERAVAQQALQIDGTLDALAAFHAQKWNMYQHFDPNDPDDYDRPSTLFDQLTWLTAAGFVAVDVCWMVAGHAIFMGSKPHDEIKRRNG
jgi:tRNA (cmo5U34)-methyltransferase